MEESPSPIDRYLVQLLDRDRPRICFVATPSGDSVEMIDKFYAAFAPFNCELVHLAFFRKPFRGSLPLASFATALLEQDAVFVGGGNTKSALAVWREWQLDDIFREAWRRGVLLSGMSAGAMCWFEHGLTDSNWGAGLRPLECLGFLAGGCCVHYSSEPERRIRLHQEVVRGVSGPRVAIDDGAAILYAGTEVDEALRWRSDADAYRIFIDGGAVVEESLAARSIA